MLSTKVYSCPGCRKRIKLTHELTSHMNTYTSQQVFPIHMQPKQYIPILRENENISDNFGLYEDEESILEEQNIEGDHRNSVGKSSDTGSHARDGLSGQTPQDGLLTSELSSSLREVRFSEQEYTCIRYQISSPGFPG